MGWRDVCAGRFTAIAQATPDACAVLDQGRQISYRELDVRSSQVAAWLTAQGAQADGIVAVLADRSADLSACVLGTWKAGCAYLALDPETPRERLAAIFAHTRPVAALTQARLRHRLPPGNSPSLAVDRDVLPAGVNALAGCWPDQLAYVIYTSGSTGSPKAVGVSHGALLAILDEWQRVYRLNSEVRSVLQVAGFGFDVATGDLARALLTGACLITCPRDLLLSPPDLYELMRRTGPDFAEFTPALLRPLVGYLRHTGGRLDFMRCLVAGGEPWSATDYRATREVTGPDVRIFNSYGLTETAVDNTYFEVADTVPATGYLPIGRAFGGTSPVILNDGLQAAEEGELYLGGRQLARGYLGDPSITAERFVPWPDGPPGARLYRTGDVVRKQPGGDISFLARRDDQVKVNGVRVDLLEVQSALMAHPGVQAAAVVSSHRSEQVVLAAYLLPVPGDPVIEAGAVRRFLARRLTASMIPAFISVVGELPLNANGKVDRARLPPPVRAYGDPKLDQVDNPLEATLLRIFTRVLGRTVSGTDQDFFELGGSSLLAGHVAALVRAELGAAVPATALFTNPTARDLAAVVTRAGTDDTIEVNPGRTEGPLAPAQNRLWMLHEIDKDLCAAYNIPAVVRISGPLNAQRLEEALNLLMARHAVLRTAFVTATAGPLQRVSEDCAIDLVRRPADTGTEAWLLAFARQPFDLHRPPLLRAALLDEPGGRYRLVLVMHHLVSDGWTLRILLRELGAIYSALMSGTTSALPTLSVSYLDYSVSRAERLRRGDFGEQLASWRKHLSGYTPAPVLPAAVTDTPTLGRRRVKLGTDVTGLVKDLARESRATVFVVMLAVLAGLLQRWSGRDDFIIGVPFGDRVIPGTEPLAGFFVNTVPVRFQLPANVTFAGLARLTRAAIVHAAANQDIPFDVIQQEARRDGLGAEFQVWFNFLGPPEEPPAMAGVDTEMLEPPLIGALFDLSLYVTELPEDLEIDVVFDLSRCDGQHADALIRQYVALITAVSIDPERTVRAHRLATAQPRASAQPARAFPSVPVLFAEQAARTPDASAIRAADCAVSYAGLRNWAEVIADRLADHLRPGRNVVAIFLPRSGALAAALLGVLMAGGAFCVLDPAHPEGRLAAHIEQAQPVAVLCGSGNSLPGSVRSSAGSIIEMVNGSAAGASGQNPALIKASPDGTAYLAFTSGSTGTPKLVRGGQPPVVHFIDWYAGQFGLGAHDRFAMLSGLSHDPLIRDLFVPLCTGGALCVPVPELIRMPRELRAWLADEQVTVAHLTPPLIRLLAEAPGGLLPDMRLVVSGGDMLYGADVELMRKIAPNATVVNAYGTTETPQIMSWHEIGPGKPSGPANARVPIGCGIEGVELDIRGESGQRAAVGELGSVFVRTPYLSEGLGDEYGTGDLGRYLPDGQIELAGRADGQVKIAGYRVQPAELDACARQLPYVRDCLTVATPGPDGQPCLVIYVIPELDRVPSLERLRADLRADLPAYLLPSGLMTLESLPLTPGGKPDRSALPAWVPAAREIPAAPPHSALEKQIAAIWCEMLHGVSPGVNTNFFDIGGNSMLIMRVQQRLEAETGQAVAVLALFEHPTIRALADYLSHGGQSVDLDGPAAAPHAFPGSRRRLSIRQEIRDKWA